MKIYLTFLLIFSVASLNAEPQPILYPDSRFHPVIGKNGMVVSQENLASKVGADILAQGGNAVDAAVATGFALAVTLPQAGNLGGGGFMLIYLADQKKTVAIDYREIAPALATETLFQDAEGNVDQKKARLSVFSSGVPGTVAGLLHAQEKYGKLKRRQVLGPAIELANQGVVVSWALAESLQQRADILKNDKAAARYFYKPDGASYQEGELLRQADLGKTLLRIARNGAAEFYQGKTADLLIAQMQRDGGLISHADLAGYEVIEREPVCGDYRIWAICAMPPPSSGGVHLIQMLNILEGWDLGALGHNSAAYLHLLIESMRRAYADRSKYLGDPDFYPVPVRELIDKDYAARLRKGINPDRASRSEDILPALNLTKESDQTTHFSVWDKWGNVVSNTYTLNFSYGSGIAVEGAGFLLNNEMDDFSSKPGVPNAYGLVGDRANAIEPLKRPLSSMTPAIVFDREHKPVLVTGSPGGSTIITVVMQVILNSLDFGMNPAEASASPRIHHQWEPDLVFYEDGISPDTLEKLKAMGHLLQQGPRVLGAAQTIGINAQGFLLGAPDSRRATSAAAIP